LAATVTNSQAHDTSKVAKAASTGTSKASEHSDLAKQSQNSIAKLISLPLQNNFSFGVGMNDDVAYSTLNHPVIPVSLSEGWNLINRSIIPICYQPRMSPTIPSKFGLVTSNTKVTSPPPSQENSSGALARRAPCPAPLTILLNQNSSLLSCSPNKRRGSHKGFPAISYLT
jgi:hypothetical protein